jgi:Autophagy-related protein 27
MARPTVSSTWPSKAAVALTAALLSTTVQSVSFSCEDVVADGVLWNLKPLAGLHSVLYQFDDAPSQANWTFNLNICNALNLDKDTPVARQCPQGTRGMFVLSAQQRDC